jgi:hypothetical protein
MKKLISKYIPKLQTDDNGHIIFGTTNHWIYYKSAWTGRIRIDLWVIKINIYKNGKKQRVFIE